MASEELMSKAENAAPDGTEWIYSQIQASPYTVQKIELDTIKTFMQNNLNFAGVSSAVKTTDYTILDDDGYNIIYFYGAGAESTFTLPTLADNQNRIIRLVNLDTTYNLIIDGEGAETIGGMTTIHLPKKYNFIEVLATSTEWIILDENIASRLRLSAYAGYGGTDTKIMRFTNKILGYGNCFSENHTSGYNSNAEGIEITINKPGKYSFSFQGIGANTDYIGLSLNSASLTTAYASISVNEHLTVVNLSAGVAGGFCIERDFSINDVVRVHTQNNAAGASTFVFEVSYVG